MGRLRLEGFRMPLDLRYDGQTRILYVTVDGNVRVDEFDAMTKKIVSSDYAQAERWLSHA